MAGEVSESVESGGWPAAHIESCGNTVLQEFIQRMDAVEMT
jgi:hypothetical protein